MGALPHQWIKADRSFKQDRHLVGSTFNLTNRRSNMSTSKRWLAKALRGSSFAKPIVWVFNIFGTTSTGLLRHSNRNENT